MKLTKENIYIDLRGKSKEELTDLYNFLIGVGEKPFRDKEWFLNYSNDDEKVGFSDVHFCGLGYILYEEKTEVTIEQLKEILKPKEMTKNQELREEAKKRGYTHDNFKCLKDLNHSSNSDLDKWYYEGCTDTLYSNSCGNGGQVVYKEGVWAEIVKPMETFTPISMRCTQEQFDAIKPKLKGLSIEYLSSFSECNYLVNNLGEKRKIISNVLNNSKGNYNREVHEYWNEEIFLKACGIETKPTLEQQLQKAEAEVKRLREAIEEENNIKIGDWVKRKNLGIEIFKADNTHDYRYINSEKGLYQKITDPILLESLNKLF